jgi:uncharacterized membrane protein YfcA
VLGALGSGGAILTLPVLVYVAKLKVREAVAVSQVVIGCAALFGSLLQASGRNIQWKQFCWFTVTGIPMAAWGNSLGNRLDPHWQMFIFGGLILAAGSRIIKSAGEPSQTRWDWRVVLVSGALTGLLTGLLGVGGGFLLVPALLAFGGLGPKAAAATSLPIIAVNAGTGAALNHALWLRHLPLALSFLGATLIGTFAGIALASRLSEDRMRLVLGWALVMVALFVIALHTTEIVVG